MDFHCFSLLLKRWDYRVYAVGYCAPMFTILASEVQDDGLAGGKDNREPSESVGLDDGAEGERGEWRKVVSQHRPTCL